MSLLWFSFLLIIHDIPSRSTDITAVVERISLEKVCLVSATTSTVRRTIHFISFHYVREHSVFYFSFLEYFSVIGKTEIQLTIKYHDRIFHILWKENLYHITSVFIFYLRFSLLKLQTEIIKVLMKRKWISSRFLPWIYKRSIYLNCQNKNII